MIKHKKRCKVCIRTKQKLFLKGDRCFSDKCSFYKKTQKNSNFLKSKPDYKIKLFAKQKIAIRKIKNIYGITENFIKNLVKKYNDNFLLKLEYKIDRFLVKNGFFSTIPEVRQYIIFKKQILIKRNNKFIICKRHSVILKKNDEIQLKLKKNDKRINKINKINVKGIEIINNGNGFFDIKLKDYFPETIEKQCLFNKNILIRYYSFF